MKLGEEVKVSELTRKDWIKYSWINIEEFGEERKLCCTGFRNPEEAMMAMLQWDQTEEERK